MARSTVAPLVSLLTDFGLTDPYVSEIKAVILTICPNARIVDVTHLVEKFNIRMGAFLLASAIPYFPAGTVHVGVVDPGVGSARRAIVIETERCLLVGPDNGLLIPAAQAERIRHVYQITNPSLTRAQVSTTFHGRDVFAPVAAHLACGTPSKECGEEITDFVKPFYLEPKVDKKRAVGEVFHVDDFGNIITNLRNDDLSKLDLGTGQKLETSIGKKHVRVRLINTYSELKTNEYGLLRGSHGFLEIACVSKSAAKRVGARIGTSVQLSGA
jgi:S-adenosylmethionine hydrolase